MQKIKLLHTADMHLGSAFSGIPYDKIKIRQNEAVHTALKVINDAADCDILLLSGDIFDTANVSRSVADMFIDAVASLEETKVFYSCGNHDSYYTKIMEYCRKNAPSNLFIFPPEKLGCFTLEDKKLKVYGTSFSTEHTNGTMLKNIPPCDNSYINILCTHSDLVSKAYNPCDISLMAEVGFDYVALGHIHGYSGIKSKGTLVYAYPGIPEPRGFDECGTKGYIKGEVSKLEKNLEFVKCQKRKYIDETVDISDFKNEAELYDVLSSMAESDNNICRFTFVGENNFSSVINIASAEKSLGCFHAECSDKSGPAISVEEYAHVPGLKGVCAKKTLEMLNSATSREEKQKIKNAFKILLECFETR